MAWASRAELIRGSVEAAISTHGKYNILDSYEPNTKISVDLPAVYVGVPLRPEQGLTDEGGGFPTIQSETTVYVVGVFNFRGNSPRDAFAQGSRMADVIDYAITRYFNENNVSLEQFGYRFTVTTAQIINTNETPDLQSDTVGEIVLNVKITTDQIDL